MLPKLKLSFFKKKKKPESNQALVLDFRDMGIWEFPDAPPY